MIPKLEEIFKDRDTKRFNWIETKGRIREYTKEIKKPYLRKEFNLKLTIFLELLAIVIMAFWFMFGGWGECQANPLEYGVNTIAEKYDGDLQCDCMFYGNKEVTDNFGIKQKQIERFLLKSKNFNEEYNLVRGDINESTRLLS